MSVVTGDPNYVMPIEDKLKSARERGDAYAEMFEIAQGAAQDWKYRAAKLLKAVEFYARHEHWMALTSDPDTPRTLLIAHGNTDSVEGWAMAEAALQEVTQAAA